ncbi:complex I NDUFA9 subunit family protein [Candidatus Anaplasma sp. TIGMIC]|uniref:complex I NDUFA9 subunit family protein n=1 Tax=Candidatus Anaplasma sp. TIGMIC TaxID=3020713 RepID=UPI00232BCCB5|nr:complex I NDUFA9 subunit family protein [Candidatus Anaplasma sp. TIGMIC]MDB1135285.1 complex I NDUFA9 subunit family protein [Candidatus Anaplasma sp. TIGMIC]
MKRVVVFGGSGFVGKYLVCELVARKYCVSVYTRDQRKASDLKLFGHLGQVDTIVGKLSNTRLIEKLVTESDIVVNLVGTISEPRSSIMKYLHVLFPGYLAQLAEKHGKMLVHFSAMGSDVAVSSTYAMSKLQGEQLINDTHQGAIIVRPNLIFGVEDNFFNKFANIARITPVMPVLGGGKNLLQPVHVGDVVDLVVDLIAKNEQGTYEICGPHVYSFKELMEFILESTCRKKTLLPIPFFIAKSCAFLLERKLVSLLTHPVTGNNEPIVTRDQIELMKYDIIAKDNANTVKGSGTIEHIVPEYLAVYRNAEN